MISLLALTAAAISVIPSPKHVEIGSGFFTGKPQVEFAGPIDSSDRRWLREALGRFMPTARSAKKKLTFHVDPSFAADEGYRLEVKPDSIDLSASSSKGLYWSLQTLRQLRKDDAVPCVSIQDSPAFQWRGVLLDEGRHFMGPKFVKRFIDTMSLYKFNVLHWHLTEDQGWRIEIKSHPELTRVGAWRTEADGRRTGGFYTQDQIRDIVAYAAKRNVEIVPEIEMPGHSSAAIASYPFLSCKAEQIAVPATWGVFGDVYCPGKETTFAFLDDVVSEVVSLFPSRYLHLGGDEVPKTNWKSCPNCQARMKAEGLKDEEALQGYFSRRLAKVIESHGRVPMGWDEVLKGGSPASTVVQVWNDQNLAKAALDAGHPIVLSPQSHCYLNRTPGDLTLESVYSYEPLAGIPDASKVLGGEATLWSEHITNKNCLSMFLPRGLAVAEILWRNPEKDFPDFQSKFDQQLAFLDAAHIEYGSPDRNLIKYRVQPQTASGDCRLDALFGLPGLELRYTLDGTLPKGDSPRGEDSIVWPVGQTLRVAPFKNGKAMQEPVSFSTFKSLAYGAKVTFATEPLNPYRAAGPEGLTDGLLGTGEFRDDIWLGWQGSDLVATCDLGQMTWIHEVGLHCLQQMRSWIMMPTSVRYEVSADGNEWRSFGEVENKLKDTVEAWTTDWFVTSGATEARYIRITARNYGKLPAWHNGAGGNAWIFADELLVK